MGEVQDRVQKARRQVMEEAFARWVGRWRTREEKRAAVAEGGPGAADSPTRRAVFEARESRRKVLGVSSAVERLIGGTWEGVYFAPSDGARDAARPVSRLVEWSGEGFEPQGVASGFLVSPDLLLTNWHVIPDASCAVGMHANFGHQRTDRGTAAGTLFALDPNRFFTAHERLDFALIAVRPEGPRGETLEGIAPVRLIGSPGKIQTGDPMHVIQHPGGGPRQYAVRNNRLVDILEADGFLHYESDTLKGSSGSPVFNAYWELVALHHCGVPAMRGADVLKTNGETWHPDADDEGTIQWVANEGARVSSIVAALRDTRLSSDGEQRLLDALLETVVDPLAPDGRSIAQAGGPMATPLKLAAADGPSSSRTTKDTPATPPPSSEGLSVSSSVFNISGGTVSITVGNSAEVPLPTGASIVADGVSGARLTEARAGEPTAVAAFFEKSQNFDPNYSARPGYDPQFLGVEIPIPHADDAHRGDLYTVGDYKQFLESSRNVPVLEVDDLADDEPLVLKYHHYSLVANRVLRMAMFTASNADYSEEPRQDPRPRTAFGGESWRLDPRVPKAYQLVNADIYAPAQNLDRGHLVRREDSAWGAPGLATEFANADTYHWTNCAPQHELFNQETPDGDEYEGRKGIWGAFEMQLQQELLAGGGQATIFAGPVLYANTRKTDFGRGDVVYPLKFWKVIIVPKAPGRNQALAAYGFVFDQTRVLREFGLGVETLELRKFARQAQSVAEIEALSGVRFPDIVRDADQHA